MTVRWWRSEGPGVEALGPAFPCPRCGCGTAEMLRGADVVYLCTLCGEVLDRPRPTGDENAPPNERSTGQIEVETDYSTIGDLLADDEIRNNGMIHKRGGGKRRKKRRGGRQRPLKRQPLPLVSFPDPAEQESEIARVRASIEKWERKRAA